MPTSLLPERLPPERWFPANDVGYRAERLTLRTGLGLRAVHVDGGDGEPIVLLHGWGCSAYAWHRLMPMLAAGGRRAVALDLPGHGLSDKPTQRHHYTRGEMADQVLAALDALGLESAVLVGHSMGGAIASEVALRAPSRVRALGLIAPAGFGRIRRVSTGRLLSPDWVVPFLVPLAVPRFAVEKSLQRTWGPRRGYTERDVDEYWAPSQFADFIRASRHLVHHFGWEAAGPDALRSLGSRPVCVLLGAHDRLVVAHDVAELAARIPGADIGWIADGGHALQEDSAPEVAERLIAWLARIADPPMMGVDRAVVAPTV